VADPLPEQASPDEVEAAFYSLLHRVAAERRVVVLLDALDQFEPTPRGRHLTWFKARQWPANARLHCHRSAVPRHRSPLRLARHSYALGLLSLEAFTVRWVESHPDRLWSAQLGHA